jgi:1-acylglycerone phosphate reductase
MSTLRGWVGVPSHNGDCLHYEELPIDYLLGTYAASKRSLEIMAETLRLELAPFDVKVLSLVTGAVRSNGQTYFDEFTLPKDSLYKSIESTIKSRAQGQDQIPRMETLEYATKVTEHIVKGNSGKFWYGSHADMVFGATKPPVPQEMMDAGSIPGTGLDTLGK